MCWDVSVADRGICRGRCHIAPFPFLKTKICRGEHRSPANFSRSRQHCPKENSFYPSGGIARTSLSALGLQTPLFALSCMYNVGILNICFEYSYCFFIRRLLCLLFFCSLVQNSSQRISLLFFFAKKKKRSKKRKAFAYPRLVRQCITRLAVYCS